MAGLLDLSTVARLCAICWNKSTRARTNGTSSRVPSFGVLLLIVSSFFSASSCTVMVMREATDEMSSSNEVKSVYFPWESIFEIVVDLCWESWVCLARLFGPLFLAWDTSSISRWRMDG